MENFLSDTEDCGEWEGDKEKKKPKRCISV